MNFNVVGKFFKKNISFLQIKRRQNNDEVPRDAMSLRWPKIALYKFSNSNRSHFIIKIHNLWRRKYLFRFRKILLISHIHSSSWLYAHNPKPTEHICCSGGVIYIYKIKDLSVWSSCLYVNDTKYCALQSYYTLISCDVFLKNIRKIFFLFKFFSNNQTNKTRKTGPSNESAKKYSFENFNLFSKDLETIRPILIIL